MSGAAHEELELLVASYALDALSSEERATVERHLEECELCQADLDAHRAHAAALVADSPAPVGVWDRILGEIRADGREDQGTDGGSVSGLRQRQPRAALLVAAAAVAAGLLLSAGLILGGDGGGARTEQELAAAILESDDASRLAFVDDSGEAIATAAVAGDGTIAIDASNLPPIADGVYQLWSLGDQVVSLGLLGPDGFAVIPASERAGDLVISREPAGGSVSPQGPVVATASVP